MLPLTAIATIEPITGPDVLERYTWLTGRTAPPPLWSLRYHQCRWVDYTQDKVEEIAALFDAEDKASAELDEIDEMESGLRESALGMFLGIHVIVALNHIKGALEHGGALGDHPNPFLRSRTTFFAGRWLVMPLNITLHFEHHLNYRVPWYSLPSYHQELIHIVPAELADSVWNHRPLSQLSGALGPISAAPAVVR